MSSIVINQKRAFIAQAQDDARRFHSSLANLNDAQRAAILAITVAATSTPMDLVYVADQGDIDQIRFVLDGVLLRGSDPNTYLLGSGCLFQVVPAPGTETPHE